MALRYFCVSYKALLLLLHAGVIVGCWPAQVLCYCWLPLPGAGPAQNPPLRGTGPLECESQGILSMLQKLLQLCVVMHCGSEAALSGLESKGLLYRTFRLA